MSHDRNGTDARRWEDERQETDGGFGPHHVETRERLRAVEAKHDSLHSKLDGISEDVSGVAEQVDNLDSTTVEADYEPIIEENQRVVGILKWATICATGLGTIASGGAALVVFF